MYVSEYTYNNNTNRHYFVLVEGCEILMKISSDVCTYTYIKISIFKQVIVQ